ncbi:DUF3042 family protein [Lactobacillus sp. YT155]|uniref:DUF3042 family protein n=1 Tax=Lactobacillus sp. YT155 TaxID=3060955 RepID=UPI00265E2566|nr:DUF3042 family protein [Lactobacillus sp. YT155]MDO1605572.1 DUF3042 family protein [Lactobacillus sp. YT155]
MKKHSFAKGVFVGAAATVGVLAGALTTFKKTVIEPEEKELERIEENRLRANRKSLHSHQS